VRPEIEINPQQHRHDRHQPEGVLDELAGAGLIEHPHHRAFALGGIQGEVDPAPQIGHHHQRGLGRRRVILREKARVTAMPLAHDAASMAIIIVAVIESVMIAAAALKAAPP
jgi:hypothetical protein